MDDAEFRKATARILRLVDKMNEEQRQRLAKALAILTGLEAPK